MGAKLLVVSDVHSNLEALDAVINDSEKHGPFDQRLCAGDMVGYGPNPNEVVEIMKDFIAVAGNHDVAINEIARYGKILKERIGNTGMQPRSDAAKSAKLNADKLTQENIDYLVSLQQTPHVDTDLGIAMIHGSFNGRFQKDYVRKEERTKRAMKSMYFFLEGKLGTLTQIPIGIIGHSHRPKYASCWIDYSAPEKDALSHFDQYEHILDTVCIPDLETRTVSFDLGDIPPELEGNEHAHPKVLINPGSVGQPRHGSPAACYAIIDIDGKNVTVEFRNVQYGFGVTQDKLWDQHHPYWNMRRLERGT